MRGRSAVLPAALRAAVLSWLMSGCALVVTAAGSIDAKRTAPMGGLAPLNRRVAVDGPMGSGRLRLSLEDAFVPRLGVGYDIDGEVEVVALPHTAVLLDASTTHIAPAVRGYLPLLERHGGRVWVSPHVGYQRHRQSVSFDDESTYVGGRWTNTNDIDAGEIGVQVGVGFEHYVAGAISYSLQLGSLRARASCEATDETYPVDPECVEAARSVTETRDGFVTQYFTLSLHAGKPIGFAGFVSFILDQPPFTRPSPPSGYVRWRFLTGVGVEWLWDASP